MTLTEQPQIPFGNDNKEDKALYTSSYVALADGVEKRQRQEQPQIPFGNDNKEDKALYTNSYVDLNKV